MTAITYLVPLRLADCRVIMSALACAQDHPDTFQEHLEAFLDLEDQAEVSLSALWDSLNHITVFELSPQVIIRQQPDQLQIIGPKPGKALILTHAFSPNTKRSQVDGETVGIYQQTIDTEAWSSLLKQVSMS